MVRSRGRADVSVIDMKNGNKIVIVRSLKLCGVKKIALPLVVLRMGAKNESSCHSQRKTDHYGAKAYWALSSYINC